MSSANQQLSLRNFAFERAQATREQAIKAFNDLMDGDQDAKELAAEQHQLQGARASDLRHQHRDELGRQAAKQKHAPVEREPEPVPPLFPAGMATEYVDDDGEIHPVGQQDLQAPSPADSPAVEAAAEPAMSFDDAMAQLDQVLADLGPVEDVVAELAEELQAVEGVEATEQVVEAVEKALDVVIEAQAPEPVVSALDALLDLGMARLDQAREDQAHQIEAELQASQENALRGFDEPSEELDDGEIFIPPLD